jgi:hypothetical protein
LLVQRETFLERENNVLEDAEIDLTLCAIPAEMNIETSAAY